MKKKWMSILVAIMICVSGLFCEGFETKAEDVGEDLDFSYLLTENTLVGTTETQTRVAGTYRSPSGIPFCWLRLAFLQAVPVSALAPGEAGLKRSRFFAYPLDHL